MKTVNNPAFSARWNAFVGTSLAVLFVFAATGLPSDERGSNPSCDSGCALLRLTYQTWHGMSPGAGYFATRATYMEVDFTRGLVLRRETYARIPEPMIPSTYVFPPSDDDETSWRALSDEDRAALCDAVGAWLRTNPKLQWMTGRRMGSREDSYHAELELKTSEGTYTIRINPQGLTAENADTMPRQYHALLYAIEETWGHRAAGELKPTELRGERIPSSTRDGARRRP